ncbi:MAG TPA: Hsp70 family protein, partial [Anaerolineaceae bacterium]
IERNTTIPTRKSQIFSTASDGQTQVEIHVLQGERPLATDNKSLGRFILDGIPPAPRGIPQVEVTFDIDANGILNVTASDKATNRSQHITITASSGLSDAEIDRMRKEAETHADEDRKRKELIEVRNHADNTIYTAEKTLREMGDKVPADLKRETEEGISTLRTIMNGEDVNGIRRATEDLGQTIQRIGTAVYQAQGGPAGGPGGPGGQQPGPEGGQGPQGGPGPGGEDVVDGEFKSV